MIAVRIVRGGFPRDPARMPERFGPYELLEPLASGGMARVFRGRQVGALGFEKIVAIKFILPGFASDPEAVSLFVDEARIAATLSHANIVGILDFGAAEGEYYIAMEYVAGANLSVAMRRAKVVRRYPSDPLCAYLVSEVARGLDYAHKKADSQGRPLHIVHRDVSPQNVVVSWNGEVKILDFGIARSAARSTETGAGLIRGKYSYMSPEQAAGEALDRRSDVFALGSVLYELLVRERAFPLLGHATLEKVKLAEFVPPERIRGDLPPALQNVMRRAMALHPDDRYPSAGAMLDDLLLYLASVRAKKSESVDAAGVARWLVDLFPDAESVEATPVLSPSVLRPDPPAKPTLTFSVAELESPPAAPEKRAERIGSEPAPAPFDAESTRESALPAELLVAEVEARAVAEMRTHVATVVTPPVSDPAAAPTNEWAVSPVAETSKRPGAAPVGSPPGRADLRPAPQAKAPPVTFLPTGNNDLRLLDRPTSRSGPSGSVVRIAPVRRRRRLLTAGALAAAAGVTIAGLVSRHGGSFDGEPVLFDTSGVAVAGSSDVVVFPRAAEGVDPLRLGRIAIRTVPAGAELMVDGESVTKTPAVVTGLAVPGAYLVEAIHPDYAPWAREIDLDDTRPVELVATLKRLEVPGTVTLAIPANARAFLDGRLIGVGPKRVTVEAQPGPHQLRLRREDDRLLDELEVQVVSKSRVEVALPAAD